MLKLLSHIEQFEKKDGAMLQYITDISGCLRIDLRKSF